MRFLAMLMDEQMLSFYFRLAFTQPALFTGPAASSSAPRNIKTFHKYDRDDSGQLNTAEFKFALNDLGYPAA